MNMLAFLRRCGYTLIVVGSGLVGGCGGGSPPTVDPCVTDPNLSGCNIGDTSASISIDKITAPVITSSSLNDLLDITQIAVVSAVRSYDYKTEIQAVNQSVQAIPRNTMNDPSTAPYQHTLNCDNNNTYSVTINDFASGYNLQGKTVTVAINNIDITGSPNDELTCQFGNMKLSGYFNLTNITINDGPAGSGSWTLDGELWPTVTVHDGNYRADISNPIHLVADYSPTAGLSLTGTVMDSSAFATSPLPNGTPSNAGSFIDGVGIVVSHYPAGNDPNTSPYTTYNILLKNFAMTAHLDTIDTNTAAQLSATWNGTLVDNITGTDLYLNIQSDNNNPLIWDRIADYDLDPRLTPPTSGSYLVEDTGIGSSSLMTIIDNTGKLTLTVTDNTLATGDPARTTINDSNWLILTRHLGQPGVF